MYFMSLDHDGRVGTGWAYVFAGTAADAGTFVDGWYPRGFLIVLVERYHFDGSYRTVPGTVTTLYTVSYRNAELLNPLCMTYLYARLFLTVDRLDGSGRTYLGTACAFGTAVAAFIRHRGQHEVHQVGRGAQHIVGTFADTELAASAVLLEVSC